MLVLFFKTGGLLPLTERHKTALFTSQLTLTLTLNLTHTRPKTKTKTKTKMKMKTKM